jgi:hypothetical protein
MYHFMLPMAQALGRFQCEKEGAIRIIKGSPCFAEGTMSRLQDGKETLLFILKFKHGSQMQEMGLVITRMRVGHVCFSFNRLHVVLKLSSLQAPHKTVICCLTVSMSVLPFIPFDSISSC